MHWKHRYFLTVALICALISGCGNQAVKPWQKDDLARPEMQFNNNQVESSFEQHFYFSKEGSSGGRGFSGGGCGCN